MSFKVADGYVEVHARHDRASTRRNAKEAVDDAERVAKDREGSMLKWLFKTNPKLMRTLEAPIGSIFGSPIIFAAAATLATGLVGLLSTALTTAILGGIAGGFIAGGAWIQANKDKRFGKVWKAMTSDIRGVFYRASMPIAEPLLNAMRMVGDAVEKWEPAFTRIYKALAPLIEPFTGGVLGFLEAMLPGIERALPGIQTVMLSLADHLPGLGTAMGDFFATLAENGPLLERVVGLMITWLENFFKVAGPILVFWMKGFAFWADAWNKLTDGIKSGMQWLTDTWHKIPGWWDETWGAVKQWFSDLGTSIGNFFSDTMGKITGWWDEQTGQISGWWASTWGTVTTWFSELPGKIGTFFSQLPGIIGQWLQQTADNMFYMWGFMLGTAVKQFVGFFAAIPVVLSAGWDRIKQTWSSALDWMGNYLSESWTRMINFWKAVIPRVHMILLDLKAKAVEAVRTMLNGMIDYWNKLPERMWSAIKIAWDKVVSVLRFALQDGPSKAGKIADGMVGKVLSLGKSFYNAGQDAIRGLVNGIGDLLGWAVDKAWNAAKKIKQGFLDALGIHSPSTVMRDEVGKWIPKGIAVGIEDNMGDIDKIVHDFPDTFSPMARTPMGNTTTTTDSSTNYGGVTIEVHIDNLQELEDIRSFLEGKARNNPKIRSWVGNLYEQQGEYVRSYQ